MDGGEPVVSAVKSQASVSGVEKHCIGSQCVADVIRILFVHASEGEIRKPLSRFGIEVSVLGGGASAIVNQRKISGGSLGATHLVLD